jgi:hypothetical protein
MTPDLTLKLAKLLRMLTSSHEGEVLAAANRINAIVTAHDLDWSVLLANGSGPPLTEEAMTKIYTDGYQRGHADGLQEARPARDWTPAGDTKAEAGADIDRVLAILDAAAESEAAGLLGEFETEFTQSLRDRVGHGGQAFISTKQWAVLDRLEKKLTRQGFID